MISCAASSHPYLFFHYACNPASDFHKQFQNSTAQKSLPSSFQLVRDLGIFIGLNLPQPVPFNAQGFTFLMIIKALAGSVISMIRGEAPRLGLVIRICQLPGMRWIKRTSLAMATCLFALVGAAVGFVAGGVTGSATESGVARGCGLGVVSGVVVALELFDSLLDGRFISKVVMFGTSLVNGKVFAEWVCPAMLKAFQSQTYIMSVPGHEDSDLYNLDDGPEGLAPHLIDKLPTFRAQPCHDFRCTICLENFKDGESGRELRRCGHCFHTGCIDAWLARRGSCPVCRRLVTPAGHGSSGLVCMTANCLIQPEN